MASFDIPVMLNFAISAENVQKALVECISISTVNGEYQPHTKHA